jgi:GMP synthase (glutamine-hydrolysing)
LKKALVIQHVPHEGPGLVAPALRWGGVAAEFIRVFAAGDRVPRNANGFSALIVLGGPMGVYDEARWPFLTDEVRLVERALKARLPVLGICLGAQILARAAGARVYKGEKKEIGWYDVTLTPGAAGDGLLLGLPRRFKAFHWHGDTFDAPHGSANLASSALYPNQLIRIGKRAYGVQFHLEVTRGMIEEWIKVNAGELRTLKGVVDCEKIIKDTPCNVVGLQRYGVSFFRRFIRYACQ